MIRSCLPTAGTRRPVVIVGVSLSEIGAVTEVVRTCSRRVVCVSVGSLGHLLIPAGLDLRQTTVGYIVSLYHHPNQVCHQYE